MEEKKKVPLVMYTGGLDSTFLLFSYLDKEITGPKVIPDLLYVEMGSSHPRKVAAELRARKLITDYMEALYVIEFEDETGHLNVSSRPGNRVWLQPLAWLMVGLNHLDPRRHSSFVVGYVYGDDAAQCIDELQQAWKAMCKIGLGVDIPLEFPLMRTNKWEMRDWIKRKHPDVIPMIWSCETPDVGEDGHLKECGFCHPCLRRKREETEPKPRVHPEGLLPGEGQLRHDWLHGDGLAAYSHMARRGASYREMIDKAHEIKHGKERITRESSDDVLRNFTDAAQASDGSSDGTGPGCGDQGSPELGTRDNRDD